MELGLVDGNHFSIAYHLLHTLTTFDRYRVRVQLIKAMDGVA